jgi:hypothetical protein
VRTQTQRRDPGGNDEDQDTHAPGRNGQ